jgi:hypothetical protein
VKSLALPPQWLIPLLHRLLACAIALRIPARRCGNSISQHLLCFVSPCMCLLEFSLNTVIRGDDLKPRLGFQSPRVAFLFPLMSAVVFSSAMVQVDS